MSVDGTDFQVPQFFPWSKSWYGHKFNGPGIRYEVALCIRSGRIVWIHGPFRCGEWNDMKIFRHSLINMLQDGERVETDKGYRGAPTATRPPDLNNPEKIATMRETVGRRHETVNRRFKQFRCMKVVWRHSLDFHSASFRAVAVLTQLAFDDGEELFEVDYDDTEMNEGN